MKETIDLLGKILTNILTALYEPFGFSLLLSFLAMFFYLYAYEPIACWQRLEECHSDMVSEIQRECVLSEVVLLGFCDLTYSVPNPVKPSAVDESFIRCHGRLGHLGDRERRAEADYRVHRECDHDGAVFSSSAVDIRREDWKRLEEDTVAKREDSIYLFDKH